MIRVFYKPLKGLKPLHVATLAVLRGKDSLEDIQEKLKIPSIFVTEAVSDLLAWDLVCEDDGRLQKTKAGQNCADVWWGTRKRGSWEFHLDSSWVLGEGTFTLNSRIEHLSDVGVDFETGTVIDREQARQGLCQLQGSSDLAEFMEQLDSLVPLVRRLVANSVSELRSQLVSIENAFASASSRFQVNRMYGQIVRVLSEITGAASNDEKTQEVVAGITFVIQEFKQAALRGSVREREALRRRYEEVMLATWLSGRKGLLRQIAESQPRALYVRCDPTHSDSSGEQVVLD